MFVDSALNWSPHIDHICKQTYPKLRLLNGLSGFLCSDVLIKIYKATILPILDYACIVWMDCPKKLSNKLERLQNQTLRIIFCKYRGTCSQVLRDQVKILTVFNRRRLFRFITAFNNRLSEFLSSLDKSTFSDQMTFKFVDEQLKTCNMISGSFIGINNNLNMF